MTVKEVLAQLKSPGDDARRKHNTKVGAPENQFSVKRSDIRAIARNEVDRLIRSTTSTQVVEWLNNYVVAKHPQADALREKWMKEKEKGRWAARAGWHLIASCVNKDAEGLDLPALPDRIESRCPRLRPKRSGR